MRTNAGPSWEIRIDAPFLLQLALGVRDSCQLVVAMHPSIPPLEPPVAPIAAEPAGGDKTRAAEEWSLWWQELLQQHLTGEGRIDRDVAYMNAAYIPPEFAALAGKPDLQAYARLSFRPAVDWINARRREQIDTIPSSKWVSEREVVQELEQEQGHPARAFRLRIIALSVQGKHAWSLTPDAAIVSRAFLSDARQYRDWLRSTVAALAF